MQHTQDGATPLNPLSDPDATLGYLDARKTFVEQANPMLNERERVTLAAVVALGIQSGNRKWPGPFQAGQAPLAGILEFFPKLEHAEIRDTLTRLSEAKLVTRLHTLVSGSRNPDMQVVFSATDLGKQLLGWVAPTQQDVRAVE